MTDLQIKFYCILKECLVTRLTNEPLSPTDTIQISPDEWEWIFRIAEKHRLLPMIYDNVCKSNSFQLLSPEPKKEWQAQGVSSAIRQITQSNEFLTLILHAQNQGLDPIVLKGIICRDLYPRPFLRSSVDEDLLIPADETESYHQFFLSEGLFADHPDVERDNEMELSYHKENSPTYIELHKTLFNPQSDVYGDLNALFPDIYNKTIRVQIEDVSIRTLEPSYHFLFLVLHAFKHFVHSGIGVRSICDIGLFAERYGKDIDWYWIRDSLEKTNAFYYSKALLRVVQLYLIPDAKFFQELSDWELENIDIDPLLEDILASGVHGASSRTRLHTSNITLHAITNQNCKNKRRNNLSESVLYTLFPPVKKIEDRYIYLKKMPILLPIAWLQRLIHYLTETKKTSIVSDAASSIQLGNKRIKLLKKYHIIKNN